MQDGKELKSNHYADRTGVFYLGYLAFFFEGFSLIFLNFSPGFYDKKQWAICWEEFRRGETAM